MISLAPESIEAIARRVVQLQGQAARPELSVAEAMDLTGHHSESAFYRWTASRRVRSVSLGRYRRSAILRALGGAA
jgi:hypothetical protein